jgi:hypothetical protein
VLGQLLQDRLEDLQEAGLGQEAAQRVAVAPRLSRRYILRVSPM